MFKGVRSEKGMSLEEGLHEYEAHEGLERREKNAVLKADLLQEQRRVIHEKRVAERELLRAKEVEAHEVARTATSPRELLDITDRYTKKRALAEYKKILAERYACPGYLRDRWLNMLEVSVDTPVAELLHEALRIGAERGVAEDAMRELIRPILTRFSERRQHMLSSGGDKEKILGVLGGKDLVDDADRVEVKHGKFAHALHFTDNDAYRTHIDRGKSDETNGIYYPFFEKGTYLAVNDVGSAAPEKTFLHEEQHAIHRLLDPKEGMTLAGVCEKGKNEILARMRAEPDEVWSIPHIMLANYRSRMESKDARRSELAKNDHTTFDSYATFYKDLSLDDKMTYETAVRAVPNVMRELTRKGYSVEEIIGILSREELQIWPKVAQRIAYRDRRASSNGHSE